jgi:L-lactate dehydrogenase complex protein LldE
MPMQIALMITCLGDVIRPAAGQAAVRILRRLGHEVVFPESQTCCGQPLFNSGYADLARQQAQHTIRVFDSFPWVVTPSGSCAAMVKIEFPHLFEHDPHWLPRAQSLAARTHEFCEFLVHQLGVIDVGASYHGTIAYHFACHLRMLNREGTVERLLGQVRGATVVPLARQDQCCGFGGSFAVRYPKISGSMVDDKVRCILESGASALVSTDTGCLMNMGGRLHRLAQPIEVLHVAELLDRRSTDSLPGPLAAAGGSQLGSNKLPPGH